MRAPPPSDLAGPPPAGSPVPRAIAALAAHHPVELIWQNEPGGITARIDRPGGPVFAKWNPAGSPESLAAEAERMRWLAQTDRVPVPKVLALIAERDGELLVTAAIAGDSIVSSVGLREPALAAAALGSGLRQLHAVPIADCPFPAPDWTASVTDAPQQDLVVCHGDPCAPNTLIHDGRFAGLVDLGRVGVADRWSDLAIASWSLEWNGLADSEPAFWRAYGIEPDAARIEQWRARWALPSDDNGAGGG
ncbi:aminoglycoside 3'-phosphotransferase [Agrococcus sp. ARC_14]|uniref:aminoglycoside 3'-phosphotransferase n=1 Tax=Agrococcus sp. ARC_14 TaxID=2919927 RepID=UPI001F06CA45|nr:aminoglycoside 3'-phosphotransferase [Agrococcus sp. ARC_14]MCH1883575.1 aminoglycoside 3'-phosphotransferase [Agrococcus sp. ARC_14]